MLSEAPVSVIQLARLHCYLNGVFWLVDVAASEADRKRIQLAREGWCITHIEWV